MLAVAVEFLKGIDTGQAAIGAHEFVALVGDPRGDRLVVALAAADERGAEIKVFGFAGGGRGEDAIEEVFQRAGGEGCDRFVGVGVMLDAEARVKQAEVLSDLGDRRDGGFAGAAGDALFDRDRGWNAGETVDVGARELFDELARVGRHGLHETALALGEHDVESERAFTGAGHARDHRKLAVGNGKGEVFEIVFAGTLDA